VTVWVKMTILLATKYEDLCLWVILALNIVKWVHKPLLIITKFNFDKCLRRVKINIFNSLTKSVIFLTVKYKEIMLIYDQTWMAIPSRFKPWKIISYYDLRSLFTNDFYFLYIFKKNSFGIDASYYVYTMIKNIDRVMMSLYFKFPYR
jgi:hypothetical protein